MISFVNTLCKRWSIYSIIPITRLQCSVRRFILHTNYLITYSAILITRPKISIVTAFSLLKWYFNDNSILCLYINIISFWIGIIQVEMSLCSWNVPLFICRSKFFCCTSVSRFILVQLELYKKIYYLVKQICSKSAAILISSRSVAGNLPAVHFVSVLRYSGRYFLLVDVIFLLSGRIFLRK